MTICFCPDAYSVTDCITICAHLRIAAIAPHAFHPGDAVLVCIVSHTQIQVCASSTEHNPRVYTELSFGSIL